MKRALVLGAVGFIGSNTVRRLKDEGWHVVGVDIQPADYNDYADKGKSRFERMDLRIPTNSQILARMNFDVVFQYAADMGGAGYIFTGEHDADVMHNSAMINLNILDALREVNFKGKIFYSSSACMYPAYNQENPDNPNCKENSAYPAAPDSEYGWEKLFSERLYMAYNRNYGLDIRIARFHNIFGEHSSYDNGKEKFPAAICRKVIEAKDGDEIEVWGDGKQTRSFLYINECLDGVLRLIESDHKEPVNIGSDEMISVNDLAQMVIGFSGKNLTVKNVPSNAVGVRGRNSDNELIHQVLGWRPTLPLVHGMKNLYSWIESEINKK
jgi:GDP-D-mannose 3',5'-epimerase